MAKFRVCQVIVGNDKLIRTKADPGKIRTKSGGFRKAQLAWSLFKGKKIHGR